MSLMMLAERFVVAVESLAKSHAAVAKALAEGQVSLKQLGLPPDGRVLYRDVLPSGPIVSAGGEPRPVEVAEALATKYAAGETRVTTSMPHGAPYAEKPAEPPKPRKLTHEDVRQALLRGAMAWPKDPPDSKQAAPWAADQLRAVVTGHCGPNTTKITEIKEEFFPAAMRYAAALGAIGAFASASGVPAALEVLAKQCAGATGFAGVRPEHLDGLLAALKPE